jgi:dTDP-4-amino-4,6-dideoxygalactose transaminase
MKTIPFLDLKAQYAGIRAEVEAAVRRVLERQQFILGEEVRAFEAEIARYIGVEHAITCASGTDALVLALEALGVGPGDEVITPPFTFVASAASIARLGARPVFADIDPITFNLDPAQIERLISPRTKAIMPVHLFGLMADMDAIMQIARRRGIPVVEDAAQAIGAKFGGKQAGAIGDIGCISFYPSKNLSGAGEGGLLTTGDARLAERLRMLRNQGSRVRYSYEIIGGNSRLDEIQCAVLRVKLPHLDAWAAARRRNAERYRKLFGEVFRDSRFAIRDSSDPEHRRNVNDGKRKADSEERTGRSEQRIAKSEQRIAKSEQLRLPSEPANHFHVYNQFTIRIVGRNVETSDLETSKREPSKPAARDALRDHLSDAGIPSEIYYPSPLHLEPAFAYLGHRTGDFSVSEAAAREVLSLPIYPELTEDQQREVVTAIAEFFHQQG